MTAGFTESARFTKTAESATGNGFKESVLLNTESGDCAHSETEKKNKKIPKKKNCFTKKYFCKNRCCI